MDNRGRAIQRREQEDNADVSQLNIDDNQNICSQDENIDHIFSINYQNARVTKSISKQTLFQKAANLFRCGICKSTKNPESSGGS